MSGGEMAYMGLVLASFCTFAVVLFSVSSGFRDTTKAQPADRAIALPPGSAKAAA